MRRYEAARRRAWSEESASRMRTNSTIVFACAATASGECGSRWNVRSIASAWASGNQHIAVTQMSSSVAVVSSSVADPARFAEALDELDEGVSLGADRAEDLTVALERLPLDQPHECRVGVEHAEVRCDELLEEFPHGHARVLGALARLREGRLGAGQDAVEDLAVQPLLRAEEVARRAARQAGLPTDLLETRAPVAARGEQPFGRVENRDTCQRP